MLERYIIKKKIGSGAFGTVYLVLDKNTKKEYALKKINVYRKKQKEKEYIISEIIIQKAHKSPYIIKLYDVFFEKDYIYIVSEYAENGDLNDIIQERIKIEKNDDKAKLLKKMLPIYEKYTNFIIESLKNLN